MDRVWKAVLLVAGLVGFLSLAWIGHEASDDRAYIDTALAWFNAFPVVPGSHWATRHTLILPMGLGFRMFGFGEVQSVLPSLIYSLGILALVFGAVRSRWDTGTAVVSAAVVAMTPLFGESATIAGVDPAEAFFALASLWLFLGAIERQGSLAWMAAAGMAAGLAFLSRETAGALVVFYGLAFLFRPLVGRWRYVVMGAGFWLMVGAEMAYYAWAAGDPFLRFTIALGSIDIIAADAPGTGNLIENRWLGPLVALLVNNEFGWLFWLFAPAAWMVAVRPFGSPRQRLFLRTLAGAAVVWFLVVGYGLDLRALPRYFWVTAIAAAAVTGVWIWQVVRPWRRGAAYAVIAVVAATNLLLIDLSNQRPLFAQREIIRLLGEDGIAVVHTDPHTAWRAEQLAQWAGIAGARIAPTPPPRGGYFLYDAANVDKGKAGPHGRFEPAGFRPRADWVEVYRSRGAPTWTGRLLQEIGLDGLVVRLGLQRVIWERPAVILYRTPG